jgi:hypothetical protein
MTTSGSGASVGNGSGIGVSVEIISVGPVKSFSSQQWAYM